MARGVPCRSNRLLGRAQPGAPRRRKPGHQREGSCRCAAAAMAYSGFLGCRDREPRCRPGWFGRRRIHRFGRCPARTGAPPSPPRRAPPPARGRHDRSAAQPDAGQTRARAHSSGAGRSARLSPNELSDALRGSDGGHRACAARTTATTTSPAARLAGGHARTARRGRQHCRHPCKRQLAQRQPSSASLSVMVDENGTSASLDHLGEAAGLAAERHRGCEPCGGQESPLLAAFRHLMSALQMAGATPPVTDAASSNERQRQHRRHEQAPYLPAPARFAARRRRHAGRAGRLDRHRWSASQPDHTRRAVAAGAVQPARGFRPAPAGAAYR